MLASFHDKCFTYNYDILGTPNSQIVKPWPLYTTDDCTYRENWNMAICPHKYGKVYP